MISISGPSAFNASITCLGDLTGVTVKQRNQETSWNTSIILEGVYTMLQKMELQKMELVSNKKVSKTKPRENCTVDVLTDMK